MFHQIVWTGDLAYHVQQEETTNKWQSYGLLTLESMMLEHNMADCSAKKNTDCSNIAQNLEQVRQRETAAFNAASRR